jgi:hypothetical protein
MWKKKLSYDPLDTLIASNNPSIQYFTRKDLLDDLVFELDGLWNLKTPKGIIRKQQENGSWKYPGVHNNLRSKENYNQLETFRQYSELVEKYEFNRNHPSIEKATDYLFTFQSKEGDFRGIYGNQYSPTYTASIMELLIKSGYGDDPRINKGFNWFLSNRQNDGGWAIPFRTLNMKYNDALKQPLPLKTDPTKPYSHLITGIVLRSFAAHYFYCKNPDAKHAGKLLMERFFKRDKYNDRQDKEYWGKVSYPFWFTDIVSSLDSLYFLGFKKEEFQISKGLDWLVNKQLSDGTFNLKLVRGRDKDLKYWITLAVCRIFKRYLE